MRPGAYAFTVILCCRSSSAAFISQQYPPKYEEKHKSMWRTCALHERARSELGSAICRRVHNSCEAASEIMHTVLHGAPIAHLSWPHKTPQLQKILMRRSHWGTGCSGFLPIIRPPRPCLTICRPACLIASMRPRAFTPITLSNSSTLSSRIGL